MAPSSSTAIGARDRYVGGVLFVDKDEAHLTLVWCRSTKARAPQHVEASMRVQGSRTMRSHGLAERTTQVGERRKDAMDGKETRATWCSDEVRARTGGDERWILS